MFFNDGELVNIVKEQGIPYYILKNKFKFSSPVKLWRAIKETKGFLEANDFDVINSTMPYSQLFMNLVKKKKKVLNIWFQHGPVGGYLDKICSKFSCDHIYFNSEYLKDEHQRTVFQRKTLLGNTILRYGVETKIVSQQVELQTKRSILGNQDKLLIITAGRICEWKGYHNIIAALNSILKSRPRSLSRIKFLIIGEPKRETDKIYLNSLKDMARELVDMGVLEFESFKKNINRYYKAADIFIHSSCIPEPFGLVVAEAMSQGTLVLGGSVGGVTDILKNDETGYCFDAHTESAKDQLESILLKIIDKEISDNHINTLRKNAKDLIHKTYTISSMVDQLERSYEDLLDEKMVMLNEG